MSTKIVRLHPGGDPKTGLQPCQFVDPANVIKGDLKETAHVFFTNAAGNMTAGVWEATPYMEKIDGYPVDELMVILDGALTITDADGTSETFTKGDSLIMPKGFVGTFEATKTLRKYFLTLG